MKNSVHMLFNIIYKLIGHYGFIKIYINKDNIQKKLTRYRLTAGTLGVGYGNMSSYTFLLLLRLLFLNFCLYFCNVKFHFPLILHTTVIKRLVLFKPEFCLHEMATALRPFQIMPEAS